MLRSLHISNYALITDIEIGFEKGFSVITGETGAGKSIILGALSLILGQRADIKSIKEGEQKCVIEADFNIEGYNLASFFEENELDYDGKNCLIRRELTVAGKSRAFVNDTPVGLNQLRDLSNRLIDIHSQHANLLLSNEAYQLEVVDTIAKDYSLLSAYQTDYFTWKAYQSELSQLKRNAEKQLSDLDYMRFQFQQLTDAKLAEGEFEELEREQEALSHAEEIKTELTRTTQLLSDEQMAISLLKDSNASISRIKSYIPSGEDWASRLESAYIELKDIAGEVQSFEEHFEFDPARLEWIESRLGELYDYFKKYRINTVSELITLRDNLDNQLQQIDSFDEEIEALQKKIIEAEKKLEASSQKLTHSRKKACKPIEDYLVKQLTQLGMPNIRFVVDIRYTEDYTENGHDDVQFLFSANKNREVQPVVQIASGGEISRVMLSIKALIASRAGLPTIIFDEIDTGISGEIAERMGIIMQEMGKEMQVISITHLPQIAAKGVNQYKVFKDESGNTAQTFIRKLTPAERINEIAQMLSGKQITDAARKQAEQLLGK